MTVTDEVFDIVVFAVLEHGESGRFDRAVDLAEEMLRLDPPVSLEKWPLLAEALAVAKSDEAVPRGTPFDLEAAP